MRTRYDFADGFVTENILSALSLCSAETIIKMFRNGDLRQQSTFLLSYKSIIPNSLGAYSQVTGIPVRDFFYGSNSSIVPTYTANDQFVIATLDSLPSRELDNLAAFVASLFPNDLVSMTGNPSAKLLAFYGCRTYPTRAFEEKVDVTFGYKQYRVDIKPELLRFSKSHYSKLFMFHSDYLADMATFFGVSLHWVFNMKCPMFCQTNTADDLFDRYTLMTEEQQHLFCEILIYLLEHPSSSPLEFFKKGGR